MTTPPLLVCAPSYRDAERWARSTHVLTRTDWAYADLRRVRSCRGAPVWGVDYPDARWSREATEARAEIFQSVNAGHLHWWDPPGGLAATLGALAAGHLSINAARRVLGLPALDAPLPPATDTPTHPQDTHTNTDLVTSTPDGGLVVPVSEPGGV